MPRSAPWWGPLWGLRRAAFSGVVLLALSSPDSPAGVAEYTLTKFDLYQQVSDDPPNSSKFRLIEAQVRSTVDFAIVAAELRFDRPPEVTIPLTPRSPRVMEYASLFFATEEELDEAFPAGQYEFRLELAAGAAVGQLELPPALYPEVFPVVEGKGYSALQDYEQGAAYTVAINGFSPPAGANFARTEVTITPRFGVEPHWVAVLPPAATAFVVPPGVLEPSVIYTLRIRYRSGLRTENAGFGGAAAEAGFVRQTAVFFVTRPPPTPGDLNCDGRVDFDDLDGFVLALLGRAVHQAAYPDCRWIHGDFDGDGLVTFDDIAGFVACLAQGGCA